MRGRSRAAAWRQQPIRKDKKSGGKCAGEVGGVRHVTRFNQMTRDPPCTAAGTPCQGRCRPAPRRRLPPKWFQSPSTLHRRGRFFSWLLWLTQECHTVVGSSTATQSQPTHPNTPFWWRTSLCLADSRRLKNDIEHRVPAVAHPALQPAHEAYQNELGPLRSVEHDRAAHGRSPGRACQTRPLPPPGNESG